MSILSKYKALKGSKSFKYGIPFLVLMVAGSYGLQEFTKIKYQFAKRELITPEKMEKIGVAMKKPEEVTLDKEFEKIQNINIDDWENKRGPRPWEEHY